MNGKTAKVINRAAVGAKASSARRLKREWLATPRPQRAALRRKIVRATGIIEDREQNLRVEDFPRKR